MDKSLIIILSLLFTGYILGIIFSQRTIHLILLLAKKVRNSNELLNDFWNSQKDRLFLFFVLAVPTISYFALKNFLQKIELIELFVVEGTFFAVIFSLIIKNDASKYRKRPIIDVKFKPELPDYYHMTNMHVIQNGVIIASLPTYYIRLKIGNAGKEPLSNVEVVLEEVLPRPKNFMSLNLSWSGFNVPANDIKRVTNISQGQYRQVDVIEVIQPKSTTSLSKMLKKLNNTDAPRYEAYSKGFRSCTIKPNSLSDIYKFGGYVLYLKIYAYNAKPKLIYIRVDYDGKWDAKTNLNEMREKHLRVKLLD